LTHLGAGARPGADALSRFYTMRHQLAIAGASRALVAQTPTEKGFYTSRGIPADRIVVAGQGVVPERVSGGDGPGFRRRHGISSPLVVSLSAMSRDKGTEHLVNAVRRLWSAGSPVELVLAGALLEPFSHFLDTLPAADRQRIRVLGPVSDQEKRDLLAAADVFALPSRTESFGIVYLEAWTYGVPVIGARTWGVSDVIRDGEDGLLVPFGDVSALAAAIQRLLDQPELRAALGGRGARKVRELYTWDLVYARIRDLYLQVVRKNL
jgi:glycogen synthase